MLMWEAVIVAYMWNFHFVYIRETEPIYLRAE